MHDVIVVGAGPGGSATAHYLARRGLDVLLLDKSDFPRDKTCGDGLTPRALDVLADMGLLDEVVPAGNRAVGVTVIAPNGLSTSAPIPRKDGLPGYVLVVPRYTLDDAIRRRAVASGARFDSPVHVVDIQPDTDHVTVRGERGGESAAFKGRMAVVAAGANLKLLSRMGVLRRPPPLMLAARAYYEGVRGLDGRIHFHFDGVPLPGYGWVFPLSGSSANVGAGFFRVGWASRNVPDTPRQAFDAFVRSPAMQTRLSSARRAGPVKGFPLRVDFASAPTFAERTVFVGEAAGLVNPLTGEGIDYALESGRLAAEHLADLFAAGDFSRAGLEAYDRRLRQRFQRLFVFCSRMRDLYVNRLFLNRLVGIAGRRPELKMLLVNIALGNQDASEGVSLRTILKVIFAL